MDEILTELNERTQAMLKAYRSSRWQLQTIRAPEIVNDLVRAKNKIVAVGDSYAVALEDWENFVMAIGDFASYVPTELNALEARAYALAADARSWHAAAEIWNDNRNDGRSFGEPEEVND